MSFGYEALKEHKNSKNSSNSLIKAELRKLKTYKDKALGDSWFKGVLDGKFNPDSLLDIVSTMYNILLHKKILKNSKFEEYYKKVSNNNEYSLTGNYWYYFLDYKGISNNEDPKKIIKLVCKITFEKKYLIEIINKRGYDNYHGELLTLTEGIAIFKLNDENLTKNKIIYLSIKRGNNNEIISGTYLKHNRDTNLYSGKILLQKNKRESKFNPFLNKL